MEQKKKYATECDSFEKYVLFLPQPSYSFPLQRTSSLTTHMLKQQM